MGGALRVLFACALLATLAACGPQKAIRAPCPHGSVCLEFGNGSEPVSLDPPKTTGTWEDRVMGEMLIGLTQNDPAGRPIPGMAAKSWHFCSIKLGLCERHICPRSLRSDCPDNEQASGLPRLDQLNRASTPAGPLLPIASFAFALLGLAGRNPATAPKRRLRRRAGAMSWPTGGRWVRERFAG